MREALRIVEDHARSGGQPGPYVRRMKHDAYKDVRAYVGETRQAGDKQRGAWFKEIKALPDTLEGARRLAQLQQLIRRSSKPKAGAKSAA